MLGKVKPQRRVTDLRHGTREKESLMQVQSTTRHCSRCKNDLPLEAFGSHNYCRACYREYQNKWKSKNAKPSKPRPQKPSITPAERERIKAAKQRERREEYLHDSYGLTLLQYEAQATAQGYVCAVCGQPETYAKSPNLKVDYDHETETLIGLLCLRCLGNVKTIRCFNANPKLQLQANIYIDNSQHSS
jgi:hypothetical protein